MNKMNKLMREVFPEVDSYPLNSLTPSVSSQGDAVVSMMIVADDNMTEGFTGDGKMDTEVHLIISQKKNKHKLGKDLIVKLDFYFETVHPIFETIIYGDMVEEQRMFVEAMLEVDKVMFWVVDKERKILKVGSIAWDRHDAKEFLSKLI